MLVATITHSNHIVMMLTSKRKESRILTHKNTHAYKQYDMF